MAVTVVCYLAMLGVYQRYLIDGDDSGVATAQLR